MTNMSLQPLWLSHFIEIILVLEFQLTKFIVGVFSYNSHFRPQISSNEELSNQLQVKFYDFNVEVNHFSERMHSRPNKFS